jgi:hypothetical protein
LRDGSSTCGLDGNALPLPFILYSCFCLAGEVVWTWNLYGQMHQGLYYRELISKSTLDKYFILWQTVVEEFRDGDVSLSR